MLTATLIKIACMPEIFDLAPTLFRAMQNEQKAGEIIEIKHTIQRGLPARNVPHSRPQHRLDS